MYGYGCDALIIHCESLGKHIYGYLTFSDKHKTIALWSMHHILFQ